MVEWETVELILLSNGGMQNGVFYEVSRKGEGIPLINVGDLYTETPINIGHLELFNATESEIARYSVNDGDLFFTRSSVVPSGIAFCNWYCQSSDKNVVFDSHVIRFKTDKTKVVPMFLYLQCMSKKARDFFIANAKTATMTTIDQGILGKCPIDLPPLSEQRVIASALSDADNYIVALKRLIAKKRDIKQGTMQELLRPKDGWEEKRLGAITNLYDNLRIPIKESKREKGLVPYYGANGIQDYVKGYTHDGDFVLIAEDGANDLSNYPVRFVAGKMWVNNHAHVLSGIAGKADTLFLSYSLKFVDYTTVLVGGTRAKLNGAVLKEIDLKIPPTIAEQQQIATILSDMDAEIDVLMAKLNKAKLIKQGMMEQLLTGKIRLEVESNA